MTSALTDAAHDEQLRINIVHALVQMFDVTEEEISSDRRCSRRVSRIRQVGMYVSHVTFGLSMTRVGAQFGRDRSTVAHACNRIEDMREGQEFDWNMDRVEELIIRSVVGGERPVCPDVDVRLVLGLAP